MNYYKFSAQEYLKYLQITGIKDFINNEYHINDEEWNFHQFSLKKANEIINFESGATIKSYEDYLCHIPWNTIRAKRSYPYRWLLKEVELFMKDFYPNFYQIPLLGLIIGSTKSSIILQWLMLLEDIIVEKEKKLALLTISSFIAYLNLHGTSISSVILDEAVAMFLTPFESKWKPIPLKENN